MGANRPRDGSEGFQHQGAGGVTKRYQPRHFVDEASRSSDRQGAARHGIFRGGGGGGRRALAIARLVLLCCMAACAAGGFVLLAVWLHSSTDDGAVGNWGGSGWSRGAGRGRRAGEVLRFAPADLLRRFDEQGGIDGIRSEPRLGVRSPRLAIVLGRMQKDSSSLLLLTLAKSLKELSYNLTVFAVNGGEAHPHWELVGGRVYMLDHDNYIDWSIFEGVILSSLEARVAISSLVQEPFDHVPLIWIVLEDTLGERLPLYMETGWQLIVSEWRKDFSRADVLVFPDFSLPLLYTVLDTGNFFVVPGSPVDVWAAESYLMSHSKVQSRRDNGFHEHDLVVTVVGSSFNFHELPWDCVAAMRLIGPQLVEFAKTNYLGKSLKVVVLTGNSTNGHSSAFQDIAAQLGFCDGCIKHYGLDGDINRVLLIADIVLYGSFHEEQSFPSLLVRAMSFGIPVIAPDLAVIKKYVTNGVDGFIFQVRDLKSLNTAFSLAVVELNLPAQDRTIGTSGKLLSKNMLAWDCITGYAKLLENVLQFPSETILPSSITQIQQHTWEWNLFGEETEKISNQVQHQIFNEDGTSMGTSSIVYIIEEELADKNTSEDPFMHQNETYVFDHLNELDWEDVREIEFYEDIERQEMEELAERTEGPLAKWEDIYSKTRKVLKMKFGVNEREEEELEKVGRHVCIYEIYDGAGAWPFLHRGALYRGLSLSKVIQGSRIHDVVAIHRLSVLNDTYYKDILCEYGGMLAIANRSDAIHKTPWIGFQSWRAAGRKVSLSLEAEKALEEALYTETRGDVFYYWARTDLESRDTKENNIPEFWSICDVLNNGHCRDMFEDAFRLMYALPNDISALPPMPATGHWSALNSWVMPTQSFLEFIMFSRIFVDSLDSLNGNSSIQNPCLLGSSKLEKTHCYCRVLELLVNVWAYHSARKMVYLNPVSGELEEQHPIMQRKGLMWVKYFNFTLLKSMDEDLAEATVDQLYPRKNFLWPLTGEVYCPLILEREREYRYRLKMDKRRKDKEKQIERKRAGRSQKPLG